MRDMDISASKGDVMLSMKIYLKSKDSDINIDWDGIMRIAG